MSSSASMARRASSVGHARWSTTTTRARGSAPDAPHSTRLSSWRWLWASSHCSLLRTSPCAKWSLRSSSPRPRGRSRSSSPRIRSSMRFSGTLTGSSGPTPWTWPSGISPSCSWTFPRSAFSKASTTSECTLLRRSLLRCSWPSPLSTRFGGGSAGCPASTPTRTRPKKSLRMVLQLRLRPKTTWSSGSSVQFPTTTPGR
mmetsp:Transcript_15306/g.45340  ORF Transcript_15306/g.45340 Transcript_15306/m.45340 type:complete len:200 (-) Transcript_15306:3036-3635(-)